MKILEDLMPKDYYSNMLPLTADLKLVYKLGSNMFPDLFAHMKEISLDLSMILVESFLTIFTNTCHSRIADVIMDHFLIHGPVVLMKAQLLIFGYFRKKLMTADNLGTFGS